jgi:hypothetical protein
LARCFGRPRFFAALPAATDLTAVYARIDKVVLEASAESPQAIPDDLPPARAAPPAILSGRSALDGEPRVAFFFADHSLVVLGLRGGPMKFIDGLSSGCARLFDVTADPHEVRNVADVKVRQVREYDRMVRSWSAAQTQALRAMTAGNEPGARNGSP